MKDVKKVDNIENVERALIVIDMVNGFVREGAMADPYIEHIIPEIERLTKEFLKSGNGVFFVKDTHKKGCMEFKKFPEHCLKGTSEAELVDELRKYEQYATGVYEKNSTSVIFAPHFIDDIEKMKNLKEVVGVGCCSDICDLNAFISLINYFDQNDRDVKITIPENAIETYDAPYHSRVEYTDAATKLMKQAEIQIVKKYEMKEGK